VGGLTGGVGDLPARGVPPRRGLPPVASPSRRGAARRDGRKRPFCFRLWDDRPVAFAGLWDAWADPAGRPLPTFCILTTEANELVRPVHGRMPVIVPEGRYDLWLSRDVREPAEPSPVLRPYPADALRAFPAGPAVNHPRNDGPECLAAAV
jgi:putative SOS response-associated peptidase YedK